MLNDSFRDGVSPILTLFFCSFPMLWCALFCTATVTWSISGGLVLTLCRDFPHPVGLWFKRSLFSFLFFSLFHFSKELDILNTHYLSHPSLSYALNDITQATDVKREREKRGTEAEALRTNVSTAYVAFL